MAQKNCKHYMEDCMRCGYVIRDCGCKGVLKIIDYSWEPCPRCEENNEKEQENIMTRYGFDLDGTLTKESIKQLANNLYDAGHEIFVITGGFSDDGEWSLANRVKLLNDLGVKYTKIVRCIKPNFYEVAVEKAKVCRDEDISILFDDMDMYIDEVTKDTQCLKVID